MSIKQSDLFNINHVNQPPVMQVTLNLNTELASRLKALQDIYPDHSMQGIVKDLISSAIHDLESQFPYIPGEKVTGIDEDGEPIYEDAGPTPRYLALTRKYAAELKLL